LDASVFRASPTHDKSRGSSAGSGRPNDQKRLRFEPAACPVSELCDLRIPGARIAELAAEDGVYWLDDDSVDAWLEETLRFVESLGPANRPLF